MKAACIVAAAVLAAVVVGRASAAVRPNIVFIIADDLGYLERPLMSDAPRYVAPPNLAPPGGHYSHAAVGGGLVFVAGQLPIAPTGEKLSDAPFGAQTAQVLAKVAAALRAAGSGIDRLVQVRVYVTDIADWPTFNALYAAWAGPARPARAVVPVPALHYGFRIEMEAVALA